MIEIKPRTHTLLIELPLNLNNTDRDTLDIQDALAEAIRVVMPLTRLGTLGLLCDSPVVHMKEAGA